MIITIDGPAGTGKSTVAQAVAERLNFDFLDTGAMYRALGLATLRAGINLEDRGEVSVLAQGTQISFDWSARPPIILLNGVPVADEIRGMETTRAASLIAVVPAVRALMVNQQQAIGRERDNIVTEGRDQGTVVFPQAQFKFYLDARPEERARRRVAQLRNRGIEAGFEQILQEIIVRDRRDSSRAVGPLVIPSHSIVLDTTHMSPEQVVDHMVDRVRGRKLA